MATRYVDNATIKKLFADSKGICAKCDTDLFPNGHLVGEICHIEAYSPGGNRYNKLLKKEKKENHYDNLIVLCSNCHKTIDLKENEELYGTDYLLSLKLNHKQKTIQKTIPELNENVIDSILNTFTISLEKELVEIKVLLNLITGNHCFSMLNERFNRKSTFSPTIENINTFYFSQADLAIVETIQKGTQLDQPQSYILIGPPSSGKTTIMLKIANELPEMFTHFYLSLNEDHTLDSIRKDLKYIKSFQSVVYIDDCHLNNDLACEIYYECSNFSNITLIFLYREINELSRVSENGYNLFDDLVSEIFIIDPFNNQNEKIDVLIENKRKIIFDRKGIEPKIGNNELIYKFIDKNLLKLTLLLDEWEKQPNEILDQIDDDRLNNLLYKRFLPDYEKDEQHFLKIYTTVNKFEIPFRILDNTKLEKRLLEDALVNKNNEQEFEFFHSSFANLLLLSLISEDSKFKLQFPNGIKEFESSAFKEYLKLLTNINPDKYPYKIALALNKVLANQEFDLFKFLVRDVEIKKLIVKYFKSVNDFEQYSLFFRNIAISCSNQYNYYYSEIVDNTKLNQILNATPKNFKEFKTILFIIREKSYTDYRAVIEKLPKTEIRKMILASRLNDITYTVRYICDFDRPFAEKLISDITKDEWAFLFNQASVFAISNSAIELKQIKNRQFVADILSNVDTNRIIKDSKREPIENITKLIKELGEINEGIAKRIATSISEHFLSDKISNRPLGKISKCLQELYPHKGLELSSIIAKFSDEDLINNLRNYNLVNIGRILSELYGINKEKISRLVLNSNFQDLLFSKLDEENNSGHVGKAIADLNKVNPSSAISFASKLTFEKIKNLVNKSTLEQLSVFIYSLYSTEGYEELAKKIFKSIPSKVLASKTLHKHFKITHYETIFSQFQKVEETKTKEILDCIENKTLISKSIDFRTNARKVCQSLKSLNFVAPDKIKQILSVLFKDKEFNKKIDALSVSDFIHTYAVCLAIDHSVAVAKFASRIDALTSQQLNNTEISTISDAIKLLNKNLNLNKDTPIVKTFEKHLLENYSHYRLRQISIAFINLFSIDNLYASNLIEKLDVGILATKALDIDSQENLNGCLGEIRAVNSNYWGQLTNEITRKKASIV